MSHQNAGMEKKVEDIRTRSMKMVKEVRDLQMKSLRETEVGIPQLMPNQWLSAFPRHLDLSAIEIQVPGTVLQLAQ